jgi:pimeloyl-ACP methyl ester carboxylesterase
MATDVSTPSEPVPAVGHGRTTNATHEAPEPARNSHIGLVVLGSVLAGLVGALFLVLGPLSASRENVITGAFLLAFGAGWGLLAIASSRWTSVPQRWAWTPAIAMGLTGLGLIVIRPGESVLDVLSWVWPVPLAWLVVWMVIQMRRSLAGRVGRAVLYPVFGVLALCVIGGATQSIAGAVDSANNPAPGQAYVVNGHTLHLQCTGSGSPTVVMENGASEVSSYYQGWITPAVARSTRVCTYDRAGGAWAQADSAPQDGIAVASDLHALLAAARVPGPYVLAGHSLGGAMVLVYASRYPADVAGVVLLDSMSPYQYTKIPGYPAFYANYVKAAGLFPTLARVGVLRIYSSLTYGDLAAVARDGERVNGSTVHFQRGALDEWNQLPTTLKEAQALTSLGTKPLIVVTAKIDAQEGWAQLQDDLAALSPNSSHRVMPNATHIALVNDKVQSGASSQAIIDVVQAVRSGTALRNP